MKKISFIFPVYNEEQGLDKLYEEINIVLTDLKDKYNLEVIFINDGSKDNSLNKLIELQKRDSNITVINFSRNFNHQMAVTAGIDYCTGDAAIIMDSDLQDPPKVCLELIKRWEKGYDVVYAQRKTRKDTIFKRFTAHMFYRVLDIFANIKIPKDTGDFRLIDKKVIIEFRKYREKNRFLRGIVPSLGFKQIGVLFDRNERYAGSTNYPLKKMINLALNGITSFSTVPLKMITQFGLLVSLFSFLGIIYAVLVRIFFPSHTVEGTTFIVIAVLFIGGIQMIMLGVLGTYIGRIYIEVQNRPLYIVESIYSNNIFSPEI